MLETNLKFEKVTKNNLKLAIKIQNEIFPTENGALNLTASTDENFKKETYGKNARESLIFWICKNNNIPIGITGIYVYSQYPQDAWCGWYGVLPKYRKQGHGKEIFLWTISKAKNMGLKNFHLYTDLEDNKIAVGLYRSVGMIEENYTAEDMGNEKILIFSISLTSKKTNKWNNKNLFLKWQENLQEKAKSLS